MNYTMNSTRNIRGVCPNFKMDMTKCWRANPLHDGHDLWVNSGARFCLCRKSRGLLSMPKAEGWRGFRGEFCLQ